MKWGMVIPNSTDLVINGRLEELGEKVMFRELLEGKRCVLAVNGYYEWTTQTKPKKPYLITKKESQKSPPNQSILKLACIYNNPFRK